MLGGPFPRQRSRPFTCLPAKVNEHKIILPFFALISTSSSHGNHRIPTPDTGRNPAGLIAGSVLDHPPFAL